MVGLFCVVHLNRALIVKKLIQVNSLSLSLCLSYFLVACLLFLSLSLCLSFALLPLSLSQLVTSLHLRDLDMRTCCKAAEAQLLAFSAEP